MGSPAPDAYPLTIEFLDAQGMVIHTIVVTGPGSIRLPGLAAEMYGPARTRITDGSGEVTTHIAATQKLLDLAQPQLIERMLRKREEYWRREVGDEQYEAALQYWRDRLLAPTDPPRKERT